MASKVLLVTAPDDVYEDGTRVLVAGLTQEQTQVISYTLNQIEFEDTFVIYVWNEIDDFSWLLDKRTKSNFIIFNADMTNQSLVGFLAAQKNSYYFGNLKELSKVNSRNIYSTEDCKKYFLEMIGE